MKKNYALAVIIYVIAQCVSDPKQLTFQPVTRPKASFRHLHTYTWNGGNLDKPCPKPVSYNLHKADLHQLLHVDVHVGDLAASVASQP